MIAALPWQQRLLAAPEDWNLFLGGGRGGGKSTGVGFVLLRHHAQYGERAKTLWVRSDTYQGISDAADNLETLFVHAFGRARVSHNRSDHVIRLTDYGSIEFSALDATTYDKFQGRQFTMLVADEAGNFTTLKHLDKLRSNLRMPGVPTRFVVMANPGGAAHAELSRRYVAGRIPWRPFVAKDGQTWITVPTTMQDNLHIDASYKRTLAAAVGTDTDLLEAWVSGNWNAISGAFFAKVLSDALWMSGDDRDGWREVLAERPRLWLPSLSIDWGLTAPAVVLFGMRALANGALGGDGRRHAAGTRAVIDEISTAVDGDPNEGAGWPPAVLGEEVARRCEEWGDFDPEGVVDDAKNLDGTTLISDLAKKGLRLRRPMKGRVSGWSRLKGMMAAAANENDDPDVVPIYFSERCRYLAETLPALKRSQLQPEDIVQYPKQPDHGADAARYYVCDERVEQGSGGGLEVYERAR